MCTGCRRLLSTAVHARTLGQLLSRISQSTVGSIFQGLGLQFHPGYKTEVDIELRSTGQAHFCRHTWHSGSAASPHHPEILGPHRNRVCQGPHRWDSSFPQEGIPAPVIHTAKAGRVGGSISPPHECKSTQCMEKRPTLCHAHEFSSRGGRIRTSSVHTRGSTGWEQSEALLPSQRHTEGFCKQQVGRSRYCHGNDSSGMNQVSKLWHPPIRTPDTDKHLRSQARLRLAAPGPPRARLGGRSSPPHSRRRHPAFSIQVPALGQTAGFGAGSRTRGQWGPRAVFPTGRLEMEPRERHLLASAGGADPASGSAHSGPGRAAHRALQQSWPPTRAAPGSRRRRGSVRRQFCRKVAGHRLPGSRSVPAGLDRSLPDPWAGRSRRSFLRSFGNFSGHTLRRCVGKGGPAGQGSRGHPALSSAPGREQQTLCGELRDSPRCSSTAPRGCAPAALGSRAPGKAREARGALLPLSRPRP